MVKVDGIVVFQCMTNSFWGSGFKEKIVFNEVGKLKGYKLFMESVKKVPELTSSFGERKAYKCQNKC